MTGLRYRYLWGQLSPGWGLRWVKLAATKETHFLICVVDSQIVLTTQPRQSWASSSVRLATTTSTTLPGTLQLKRIEEGGITATTAPAAASFPPSHLRVGDRGSHSWARGSLGRGDPAIFLLLPHSLAWGVLTLPFPLFLPPGFPRVY